MGDKVNDKLLTIVHYPERIIDINGNRPTF